MTDTDRQYLLNAITSPAAQSKIRRNNWPGLPITQLPVSTADTLRAMIDEGVFKLVERPGRSGTHTYVARAQR